ncbi:unannotated protein [freshwater metagenome]|uniref:Unannotated protein n=1 Tax=freshwater metagenome TaxID=449393 RepID=A0A6J6K4C2_9ZZZZ
MLQLDHGGKHQQRHKVHHLDERVECWASGVLEWIANRVADDSSLMGFRTLAAFVAIFDVLLGVVPCATCVGQEVGHELTSHDRGGKECTKCKVTNAETDDDGRKDCEKCRRGKFTKRCTGADVDHCTVIRTLGVVHDAGLLAELAANLFNNCSGRARHSADRK